MTTDKVSFSLNFSDSASRRCSEDGLWLDFEGNEDLGVGWTNFSQCFDPQVWLKLAEKDNKTGKI